MAVPICQRFPAVTLLQPAAMKKSFVGSAERAVGRFGVRSKAAWVRVSKPRKFPVPFTLKLNPPLLNVFTVMCGSCTVVLPASVMVVAPES